MKLNKSILEGAIYKRKKSELNENTNLISFDDDISFSKSTDPTINGDIFLKTYNLQHTELNDCLHYNKNINRYQISKESKIPGYELIGKCCQTSDHFDDGLPRFIALEKIKKQRFIEYSKYSTKVWFKDRGYQLSEQNGYENTKLLKEWLDDFGETTPMLDLCMSINPDYYLPTLYELHQACINHMIEEDREYVISSNQTNSFEVCFGILDDGFLDVMAHKGWMLRDATPFIYVTPERLK